MTTYTTLMILSSLVIFSYLFDLLATKTKLPSVLLLLLLGIGLRLLVDELKLQTYNFLDILPALGTVGLILIVFEGALDLKYDKNKVIKGAFFAAFFYFGGHNCRHRIYHLPNYGKADKFMYRQRHSF